MLKFLNDLLKLFGAKEGNIKAPRTRKTVSSMTDALYRPPTEPAPAVVEVVKEIEVERVEDDMEMVKAMIDSMSSPGSKPRHPNTMVAHDQEWDLNWLVEEE